MRKTKKIYRKELSDLHGNICQECKKEFEFDKLTIGHIIPLARGGKDNFRNIQLECGNCNTEKSDYISQFAHKILSIIK